VLFLVLSVLSLFAYRKVRGSTDWKAPLNALEGYSWEVRIQDATPVYFLAVWVLTVNVLPFVISRFFTPIYYGKYTIAASVALYLLVAKGIRNINYKYAKLAIICIIVILSAANLQTFYGTIQKAQGREAIHVVNGNATSGDVVIITPQYHWEVWQYYGKAANVSLFPASPAGNDTDHIQEFQRDVNGHGRVWLLVGQAYTAPGGAEKLALNALNESYRTAYFSQFLGYRVYLFEKRV
jgi:hypothetical protein